jgi:hypothetical protein
VSSTDNTEGRALSFTVTFTPGNWNVPRTVTVVGINDPFADGNQPFSIITGPASSSDPGYNMLDAADVAFTNWDNDTAQVYVKSRPLLSVRETGTQATFRVRLMQNPTAAVSCPVITSDASEGTVAPASLAWSPGNFGFRTVTVTGVNDTLDDGDVMFAASLPACTSSDTRYGGENPPDVLVLNVDND